MAWKIPPGWASPVSSTSATEQVASRSESPEHAHLQGDSPFLGAAKCEHIASFENNRVIPHNNSERKCSRADDIPFKIMEMRFGNAHVNRKRRYQKSPVIIL